VGRVVLAAEGLAEREATGLPQHTSAEVAVLAEPQTVGLAATATGELSL